VTAAEATLSVIKTGKVNTFDLQGFDSDDCKNDVNDRVKGSDFMKMDLFNRSAVYLCLGFSNSLEDRDRMLFGEF